MQKKNFKPKEDKAKHSLMIRTKISHFLALKARALRWRKREMKKKRRRKKEEEEKMKSRFGNHMCMEFLFGTLVFVCMEPMYGFVG